LSTVEQTSRAWSEELYRIGMPTLMDYVEYVRRRGFAAGKFDEAALIDQWRQAWQYFQSLEKTESGLADSASVNELSAEMTRLVERVMADRYFVHAYGSLPISFGIVDLDRLAVFQRSIALEHSKYLADQLYPPLSDAAVFRFCMPYDQPAPSARMIRSGRNRFVFESADANLRYLGAEPLDQVVAQELAADGPLAAALALSIGFGSSYLNVVRLGPRMVLNNGYHRAHALRSLGVTHVPCVIQVIAHPDELAYAGGSELIDHYATLFSAPRPPLFKDFFDSRLTTVLKVQRTRQQLQINIDVQTIRAPS
jgi:hypothetical protein